VIEMGAWVLIVVLLITGAGLLVRGDAETIAGIDINDFAAVTVGCAMLFFLYSSVRGNYQGRGLQAARDVFVWCVVGIVFVGGYSFRDELRTFAHRVVGEIAPPGTILRADAQQDTELAVRIRRRPDGHFIARASINGATLPMLVDTGASTVVLRQADAQKIGIDTERLKYTVPVQTANGTSYAAHVRIKSFSVGTITFTEVEALVSKPGALRDSLLGMSFLNRLRSYEFSGDFLTMRI
jgi:aspartyl protease family protein